MIVAIVDYGSGNLHSAQKAFERSARNLEISVDIRVSYDADFVSRADYIVLPGVGAFADCRAGLDAVDGMVEALHYAVMKKGQPFLGICVGMQLMATRGLEYTTTDGLNWIKGDVVAIETNDPALKIPHMGWNNLERQDHAVLNSIPQGLHAYFVHSFHMNVLDERERLATTDYGGKVTAMIGRDNMLGTQFHPEKSQSLGLKFIGNYLRWRP